MEREALSAALKREHREIDEGIGEFVAGLAWGGADATPLKRALEGLRRHIYLEEEFLFPPLRAVGLMAPVLVMLREHGEIWRTMDRLDAAAARGLADRSVRRLCAGLRGRLDRHSSKEEPMCYPQADRALTPEAASRLRGFLASGRLPEGWTCRQVRVWRPSGGGGRAGTALTQPQIVYTRDVVQNSVVTTAWPRRLS